MKKIGFLVLSLFVFLSCSNDDDNGGEVKKSDAKEITAFTFLASDNDVLSEDVKAVIHNEEKIITAEVPSGTDVKALKPTIVISDKATVDPKEKVATDFTEAVTYTVTAEDGSTAKYAVTVTIAKSEAKQITSFVFLAADNSSLSKDVVGVINEAEKRITLEVPSDTDITALVPFIVVTGGVSVDPDRQTAQDFSQFIEYAVTAEDGTTATYTVQVNLVKSSAKEILSFQFLTMDNEDLLEDIDAVVNEEEKTITAEVPFGTFITFLKPTIVISDKAEVNPKEKVAMDFTDPVEYTVTAEDGTTITYIVTFTVTVSEDMEVLKALYDANPNNTLDWNLEGDDRSKWNFGENENRDVYFENGRVVKLTMPDASLDNLPASIGNLTNLEELNIRTNSLTVLPVEFGRLTNLRVLNLNDNSLTAIPTEIGDLTNLEDLRLAVNSLTSIPREVGKLTRIKVLNLSLNPLTSSIPVEIGNLTALEDLRLSNSSLLSIPNQIGQLLNLRELYLSQNSLTTIPASIGNLRNLEKLELMENSLISLPGGIGNLGKLTNLDLRDNALVDIPSPLGRLTNLESLDLRNNSLASLPSSIGDLTNLGALNLSNNSLTALPSSIGNLSNLDGLNLSNNSLTFLPAEMGNLGNLTNLFITNNQIAVIPKAICDLNIINFFKDSTAVCEE